MPSPKSIIEPKQLLVEGKSMEIFFRALLDSMTLKNIQLQDFGSIGELRGFLKALRITPGFEQTVTSLGIVRDAEEDADGAFRSVCGALQAANLPIPSTPVMLVSGSPNVSVLILPDGTTPGALETLCLRSVENDLVMECIEQYFACIGQRTSFQLSNTTQARAHKAKVLAFLASREKHVEQSGRAAQLGYWPWDSTVFDPIKLFLRAL